MNAQYSFPCLLVVGIIHAAYESRMSLNLVYTCLLYPVRFLSSHFSLNISGCTTITVAVVEINCFSTSVALVLAVNDQF